MCLLCSGFFCCIPLKPLTVCWSSISQINGKEHSKSDNELESKAMEQVGFSNKLKRSSNTSPDVQNVWMGNAATKEGPAPDILCPTYQKNFDKNKSHSKPSLIPGRAKLVIADRSLLDCGANCCIMPHPKTTKLSSKSKNFEIPLQHSSDMYIRRESDPGCESKGVSQLLRRHRKRASRDVVQVNVPTEFVDHRNALFENPIVDGRDILAMHQLQALSQCDLCINGRHETVDMCPSLGRASSANLGSYRSCERYYTMSSTRQATMETMTSCATYRRSFRRSRSSSRSESTTYRDTVSEVSSFVSRHLSPILRRKNMKANRCRSRDVSQTTNPQGSEDVLVMVERPRASTPNPNFKQDTVCDGCDAMTQTEWNNGWETMPSGFISYVRERPPIAHGIARFDSASKTLDNNSSISNKQVPTTSYRTVAGITRSYGTTFSSIDKGGPQPDRLVGGAWNSMDNLGFLSSGESSDQTRTASTCSTSHSHFRTKDDWALCKSSRKSDEYRNALPRYNSDTSLDREMAQLSQEMATIQLECEVLVSRHINERMKMSGSQVSSTSPPPSLKQSQQAVKPGFSFEMPRKYQSPETGSPCVPSVSSQTDSMGEIATHESSSNWGNCSNQLQHDLPGNSANSSSEEDKDSSSAYNTGESSGSTAMGVAGSNTSDEFQKNLMTLFSESEPRSSEKCDQTDDMWKSQGASSSRTASVETEPEGRATADVSMAVSETGLKKSFHTAFSPGTIMYTNEAHLQHTILLQQQILRRALTLSGGYDHVYHRRGQGILQEQSVVGARCVTCHDDESSPSKTPEMEWRVKRRPDGTRYITRRPSRTKILKERAQRISEERRGLTTDDDATSEMKLGRYWSKEERKRHLERARERKRKEIGPSKSRLSVVREGRLSLVVVQEEEPLTSPGPKKPCSGGKYSPINSAVTKIGHCTKLTRTSALLSVTTV